MSEIKSKTWSYKNNC